MHDHQLSRMSLDLPIVSLFIMPQLRESFFTNQDMMVQQPLGQHSSRAPSWGPSRHQPSIGSHQAEALHPNKAYMDDPERSQEIVPLVPTQAWPPGWMPTITQELKRYGELRHETYDIASWMADHNSTQRMRSKPYSRWDRSSRTRAWRSNKVDLHTRFPLWDQEVS